MSCIKKIVYIALYAKIFVCQLRGFLKFWLALSENTYFEDIECTRYVNVFCGFAIAIFRTVERLMNLNVSMEKRIIHKSNS